ncbi:transposase [Endozoicomonas montiporae]|uniref:transposase n=1 Tax=Endozoicomonas montiporae TaxID=1027273 RepID=UPI00068BCF7B|nr:transposase [Endozoicomonas montiporae]
MMGLILYGIMQGVTPLRALERLARLDLGCMWVSGGIHPDHANIGRFINIHEASLTGDFFDEMVQSVLKETNSGGQRLAGDGTTIEAACSNYNLIKEEAARAAQEEARKQADKAPEDPK